MSFTVYQLRIKCQFRRCIKCAAQCTLVRTAWAVEWLDCSTDYWQRGLHNLSNQSQRRLHSLPSQSQRGLHSLPNQSQRGLHSLPNESQRGLHTMHSLPNQSQRGLHILPNQSQRWRRKQTVISLIASPENDNNQENSNRQINKIDK